MTEEFSSDERMMAAVAHGSVIVFGTGVVASVLIWLTQKEKSRFTSWQAMQATVYQIVGFIITMGLWMVWGVLYIISLIPMMKNPAQYNDAPPPIFWIGLAVMIIPLGVMLLWIVYGLWGAYQTLRGRDFRYWLIGSLLAGFESNRSQADD